MVQFLPTSGESVSDEGDLGFIIALLLTIVFCGIIYLPLMGVLSLVCLEGWPVTMMMLFEYGRVLSWRGAIILWIGSFCGWATLVTAIAIASMRGWEPEITQTVFSGQLLVGGVVFLLIMWSEWDTA